MSADERRKFPRIPLLSEMRVTKGDKSFTLATRDLSAGGARVERGDSALSDGDALSVQVRLPGGGGEVTAQAVVAWQSPQEVGLKFVDAEAAVAKIQEAVAREIGELESFEDMKTPPREA